MAFHCLLDQIQTLYSGLHSLLWSGSCLPLALSLGALLSHIVYIKVTEILFYPWKLQPFSCLWVLTQTISSRLLCSLPTHFSVCFLSIPFQSKTSMSLPPGRIPSFLSPAQPDPTQSKYWLRALSPMHSSGNLHFLIKAHSALFVFLPALPLKSSVSCEQEPLPFLKP